MPTLNTFGSARGFGRAGAAKPNAPTINSVTRASDTSVTITYTLGANNGAPITSVGFTSSPSIALTFTNTDLDGTITVTGTFVQGTSYTFTMTATNAVGTSDASAASESVTPNAVYALSQTFNSSGTYTVPAGKTKIAVWGIASGGSGNSCLLYTSDAADD